MKRTQSIFILKYFLILGVFAFSNSANAAGEFYLGSGASIENFKTRYEIQGDSSLVPSLSLRDFAFSDRDGGNEISYGLNGFVGYRHPLPPVGVWFGIQYEAGIRVDALKGRVGGTGVNQDGTQLTGILEENWELRTELDRALVLKAGIGINLFGLLNFEPYALIGLREIDITFDRLYQVCGMKPVCAPGDTPTTAVEVYQPIMRQPIIGAGIEKSIGSKSALQFEARYVGESDDDFRETINGVETAKSLSTESFEISLRLVFYL